LGELLGGLDFSTPLGLYECPYPSKRLLPDDELAYCASTGRFRFLKDTCCDIDVITRRLDILADTPFRLYNANTATLLASLKAGAAGFSGIMANFHPELYVGLASEPLQSLLTICSWIEGQYYPVNAKYHLNQLGLPISTYTRSKDHKLFTKTQMDEVRQMNLLIKKVAYDL
jgi:4-hydroxy-tetrahydrodipicolinate synthase